MASTLQAALTSVQQNNYLTVAIFTAVAYDYVVTSLSEIEYIWSRPWTRVSSLFFLIRYFGLYSFIIQVLMGSSLIFVNARAYVSSSGFMMNIVSQWTWFLFLAAADLVMILRVWAMYTRSKLVLGTLLSIYVVENVLSCVGVIYYSIPHHMTVYLTQIQNFSFCSLGPSWTLWTNITSVSQLVLGSTMFVLVFVKFVRQSSQIFKAKEKWQGNRYVNLLVREGVLYFVIIQAFNLVLALATLGKLPTEGPGWVVATIVQYVPLFTLVPRFVINMRGLYARGTVIGEGIDSAFGLSSRVEDPADVGAMVFAEASEDDLGSGLIPDDRRGEEAETIPVEEGWIQEEHRDAGLVFG